MSDLLFTYEGSVLPVNEEILLNIELFPSTFINHPAVSVVVTPFLVTDTLEGSNSTGWPSSPESLSLTRLKTLRFVPLYTFINSPLSAFVFDDASLNWVPFSRIAKYVVFSDKFSGKSPLSLIMITFSPVDNLCIVELVKTPSDGSLMLDSFTLTIDGSPVPNSCMKIFADCSWPDIFTNNSSSTFAPTRNPCVTDGGLMSSELNPKRYNLLSSALTFVLSISIEIQSISSSAVVIAFGGIICVINALSSFSKACFLNPSDTSANWPKLEFELVIEASAPDFASKWTPYPIANTDTICNTESFDIFTCLVCHPSL